MADVAQIPHVAHHVQHVAAFKPLVIQGYSMLTLLISNTASAALAGGLAWYVRGRGMAGVKIDLNNVELAALKNKIDPVAPAPAVAV